MVLATGGYGNTFYLSTMAKASNATAIWRAHKRGALFANPCFTQIHPTCIPQSGSYQSKLTLMSESLRNDGRIWVPKKAGDKRRPDEIPEEERDYYLERLYPSFGNLVPRDVASRRAKEMCDKGFGVGPTGLAVYLDFGDAIQRNGKAWIEEKYGNLFDMYHEITAEDPVQDPDADLPGRALHDGRPLGGLQPDEHDPGPLRHRRGELLRPRREPPRRERADAGTRGRVLHPPVHDRRLPRHHEIPRGEARGPAFTGVTKEVQHRIDTLMAVGGNDPADDFHKALGKIMWDKVGMGRNKKGLTEALKEIPKIRAEFWKDVKVVGSAKDLNAELERAGRVADFLETGRAARERRAQPRGILRRTLPRGIPDRRGRGQAERRAVLLRRGLGVCRGEETPDAAQGTAHVRIRETLPEELQVMNFTLKVWRQKNRNDDGRFVHYTVRDISPDASFLEMLDVMNADLVQKGEEPVAFDHDCREGICGSCGLVIDGRAHGPNRGVATCELRMRSFTDGDHITVEPWRAKPFPVIKDLVVDRTAFDRVMQAGGFVSVKTGGTPDANAIPIRKDGGRRGHGRGGVHRVRRLRGGLQEQLRDAVRRGEGLASRPASAGTRRTGGAGGTDDRTDGRRRVRRLLEHVCVRGGMPEADLRRPHRPAEQRVHQGEAGVSGRFAQP